MSERTEIWNCGGGTQSAAIAALIVTGALPKPDLAVIVDTERERSSTWRYVDGWLIPALHDVGVTLHRVPKSRYATVDVWGGKDGNSLLVPAFTDRDGEGKLPAFCSTEWKARVVQRWAVQEYGVTAATNWLGFSTDEAARAQNVTAGKWQRRYPLLELGISRSACYALVRRIGWPAPPRSSCWMCPNHSDVEWDEIKRDDPADFALAVAFGADIQKRDSRAWLHNSCEPLDTVDFTKQGSLFGACNSGQCFT